MVTDAGTLEQLVIARARIAELEAVLRRWYETQLLPPIDRWTHQSDTPNCPTCNAEWSLYDIAKGLPALPTAAVTP